MALSTPARATGVAVPANNTEAVALFIPGGDSESGPVSIANLPTALPVSNNRIRGAMNYTPGATTTAVIVRVRRGNGVGGAQVGVSWQTPVTAAVPANIPFDFLDAAAQNVQGYSVTMQNVAATAVGAVNEITGGVEAYQ